MKATLHKTNGMWYAKPIPDQLLGVEVLPILPVHYNHINDLHPQDEGREVQFEVQTIAIGQSEWTVSDMDVAVILNK